jgi:hypothetical protein
MDTRDATSRDTSDADAPPLPAWVVPLEPLRFVLSSALDGADDPWQYDLTQVMAGTYDSHLLARISASLPSVHPNLPVFISFGGVVALAKSRHLSTRTDAAHEFNRIIGHLVLGGVFFHAVRPGNVMNGFVGAEGWITLHGRNSDAALRERNWEVPPLIASGLHFAGRVQDFDLHRAYALGEEVHSTLEGFPVHVLSTALTSLWQEDFESALLSFWTCIEHLLIRAWKLEFLAAPFKVHPALEERLRLDRMGAGEMVEMLRSAGRIDASQFGRLTEVRTARNDLAHASVRPTAKVVKRSATLLFDLAGLQVRSDVVVRHWRSLLDEVFGHLNPPPVPTGPQPVVDDGRWLGPLDPRELLVARPKYEHDPRAAATLVSEMVRKRQESASSMDGQD